MTIQDFMTETYGADVANDLDRALRVCARQLGVKPAKLLRDVIADGDKANIERGDISPAPMTRDEIEAWMVYQFMTETLRATGAAKNMAN